LFDERVIREGKNVAFFFFSYPRIRLSTYDPIVGRLGSMPTPTG